MIQLTKINELDYKNPVGLTPDLKGKVWIILRAKRLAANALKQSGTVSIEGANGPTFTFLAPNELTETLTHTYENQSSLASRLKSVIGEFSKAKSEFDAALGGLSKASEGNDIYNAIAKGQAGLEEGTVVYKRIDEALVYQNTERRKIDLTFTLLNNGDEGEPNSITAIVRALQRCSTPEKNTQKLGGAILPPYYFNVETINSDMLLFKKMIIRSLQYTYKAPYVNDSPSLCDLTISFEALEPIYRAGFEESPKVSIGKK